MALYNNYDSMLGTQQPQQNQYLTGNPATQPNANTLWMDQSQTSPTTGINGGGGISNISQQQSNPPSQVSNGTMLGSIAAGNVGTYMPGGYDQAKFNDPANANSTKYQVGRILSKYPPGPEGLQAASQELSALGISVIGKDKIKLPDGTTVDVGFSFSDPNAQHNWQYNWSGPLGSQQGNMPGNSMFGMQQGNNQFSQNNMMNQIWQALQARRYKFSDQQFNPSGGYVPPSGNTGVSGQIGMNPQPQFNIPSLLGLFGGSEWSNDPHRMYFGGGVYDPATGMTRQPRYGEPQ